METKWFTLRTVEDKESIAQAADILRRGGLLAIPTETVYGFAAGVVAFISCYLGERVPHWVLDQPDEEDE